MMNQHPHVNFGEDFEMHGIVPKAGRIKSDTIGVPSFATDQPEGHQRFHGCKLHHCDCIQAGYSMQLSRHNVNILHFA